MAVMLLPKQKSSQEYQSVLQQKIVATNVLMSLVLTNQERSWPQMEEALQIILNNKKVKIQLKNQIEKFISLFWQNKEASISFNNLKLSEQTLKQIKEI